MKCKYAISFEFKVRGPITIRGEVEAGQPHTLAMKALREAKKKAKSKESVEKYGTIINWSSIVILLDRNDYMGIGESEDETLVEVEV